MSLSSSLPTSIISASFTLNFSLARTSKPRGGVFLSDSYDIGSAEPDFKPETRSSDELAIRGSRLGVR